MKESEKKIRKFIGPSLVAWIVILASLAATVALVAVGLYYGATKDKYPAEPFDPLNCPDDSYCYFDAVGVSEWLYDTKKTSNGTTTHNIYYAAEDAEGYMIIATIKAEDYRNMMAQRIYWDRTDNTAEMPEPYRMTGLTIALEKGNSVRSTLASVVGVNAGDEFENYFGNSYLAVGGNPRASKSSQLEAIAFLVGLFCVIIYFSNSEKIRNTSRSIKVLREKGKLDSAASALEMYANGAQVVTGGEFLFIKGRGVAITYDSVKEASCLGTGVKLKTDHLKDISLKFGSKEAAADMVNSLPLGDGQPEEMIVRKREE